MAQITYIKPSDQPSGRFRMLDWLETNFKSDLYNNFRCLVAFAKIKPFYKLHLAIQEWNSKNKTSEAVFGIDHKGTSIQALQYALSNFDTTKVLHVNYATFHPKLYIFWGDTKATIYYGSSNFTSGGLETNFEGGTIQEFDLPQEEALFHDALESYSSIADASLSCVSILSTEVLQNLKQNDLLMDETIRSCYPSNPSKTRGLHIGSSSSESDNISISELFGSFAIKPARAIPKSIVTMAAESAGIILKNKKATITRGQASQHSATTPAVQPAVQTTPVVIPLVVDSFVIQISPHHNGEIFLSKRGVEQNKSFFAFPFTGKTVPKKAGNTAYPQRTPDPIVNIRVFDSNGDLVNTEDKYPLNTIYYEKKSEIRITITPSILAGLNISSNTNDYPILVMSLSETSGCDYDMDFFAKGSTLYDNYLSICDQTLPSGGKPVARKMGWI